MTDYVAVLVHRHPGAVWVMNGRQYSGLVWLDDSPKPTKTSLDGEWPSVQHEMALEDVKRQRQARYEAETDPLYFKAMRNEDGVTVDDWKAAVAAIQTDLPYPVREA